MATWTAQPEDLDRVFREQNPWHADGVVPAVWAHHAERALGQGLWSRLHIGEPRRFHLILGPRRVGKTTVMYQTVRHLLAAGHHPRQLWWLRLDHPLLMGWSLGDLVKVIVDVRPDPTKPLILFLDEIVYAKDWDLWLKTFYDDHWPVEIVATSSATAMLRDRRLESGVGRWQEHYLTPYTFSEFLDLSGTPTSIEVGVNLAETMRGLPRAPAEMRQLARLRREFLFLGGFPELLLDWSNLDDADQLLRSQQVLRADAVERAVYKDIPQSFGVDNPLALERLLYTLGGQISGLISPTQIGGGLGMTQPTFDRYLSYLERAFLVFTLPNFSGSEASVQKRGRKLYFVDGAVRNAALQRGLAPLTHLPELGLLQENLAAATLNTLGLQGGGRLFHWRDGKTEVDLVLDHPTDPLAFEIGSDADHSRSGLIALMGRHPRLAGRAYLVAPEATTVQPDKHPSGVGTISLDLFLLAAGRQADAAQWANLR
jgi:uncharacterized protein